MLQEVLTREAGFDVTVARVAGERFTFDPEGVEHAVAGLDAEPIKRHYVVVGSRRYPPKQVIAAMTGLDRADFTTHQARSILRRLGFGVHRRHASIPGSTPALGAHLGAESVALSRYVGRWIAQDGLEILFDADHPQAVLRWLRKNGLQARVWRVPATPAESGSTLSVP